MSIKINYNYILNDIKTYTIFQHALPVDPELRRLKYFYWSSHFEYKFVIEDAWIDHQRTKNQFYLYLFIVRWGGEILEYLASQTRKLRFWTEWLPRGLH